jgi:hypothetical protein
MQSAGLDPQHTVRVDQPTWDQARANARAQRKRDGVSQVLREFLAWYTWQPGSELPERPPAPEAEARTA